MFQMLMVLAVMLAMMALSIVFDASKSEEEKLRDRKALEERCANKKYLRRHIIALYVRLRKRGD